MSDEPHGLEEPAIEWERHSTFEHRARRGGRLVGLVTRPAQGVFWAHRTGWSPDTGLIEDHGPKTRHRTLADAKAAIEQSAPPVAAASTSPRRTP